MTGSWFYSRVKEPRGKTIRSDGTLDSIVSVPFMDGIVGSESICHIEEDEKKTTAG